jgi:hypothetical protein
MLLCTCLGTSWCSKTSIEQGAGARINFNTVGPADSTSFRNASNTQGSHATSASDEREWLGRDNWSEEYLSLRSSSLPSLWVHG